MANLVFDFLHNYHAGERRDSEPANAYQYDEGHVIEAVVPVVVTSCEIHYWIRGMEKAEAYVPDSITPNADGTCTILGHVPNEYFQTNGELRVYIVVTDGDASLTTYEGRIQVCQRSMPDDYVDDDPDNEATRVLTEAREAAATATAAAKTCEEVQESIPEDYSTLSDDVSDLKDGFDDLDDRVTALEEGGSGSGLTEDIKQALLQIAEKIAYIDEDGQDYYDALEDALYPPADLVSISAVYTQSGTVYDTDTLDSLKSDLVVTAHMSDSTTQTVTNYVLSGTLTVGTSTITVSYGGKTTTFTVTVTENRQIPTSYTWLYDARQGELLSERTDLVTPTIQSGCTETLVDGLLHLFVPRGSNNLIRYRLVQETNTNAKLTAKVKFESINYATAGTALRLQVSNGTNGAQIFERYNNSSYKFGTFEGTTYTEQLSLELNTWYIISVERNNGKQIVTVDGNEILNSSTLSSNYCTSNAIFLQNAGGSISVYDTNVDIDWITYKNND